MSWEILIQQYGYLAILIGTFLEGELVIIAGALAAQLGYLEVIPVVCMAASGTAAGDLLAFVAGRRGGRAVLDRRPRWAARTESVLALLERHQVLVILGYRFLYGLRLTSAFVIGMSPVPTRTFLVLGFLGILVWASAVAAVGYGFGYAVRPLLGLLEGYQGEAATVAAALLVSVAVLVWWRRGSRTGERPDPL